MILKSDIYLANVVVKIRCLRLTRLKSHNSKSSKQNGLLLNVEAGSQKLVIKQEPFIIELTPFRDGKNESKFYRRSWVFFKLRFLLDKECMFVRPPLRHLRTVTSRRLSLFNEIVFVGPSRSFNSTKEYLFLSKLSKVSFFCRISNWNKFKVMCHLFILRV